MSSSAQQTFTKAEVNSELYKDDVTTVIKYSDKSIAIKGLNEPLFSKNNNQLGSFHVKLERLGGSSGWIISAKHFGDVIDQLKAAAKRNTKPTISKIPKILRIKISALQKRFLIEKGDTDIHYSSFNEETKTESRISFPSYTEIVHMKELFKQGVYKPPLLYLMNPANGSNIATIAFFKENLCEIVDPSQKSAIEALMQAKTRVGVHSALRRLPVDLYPNLRNFLIHHKSESTDEEDEYEEDEYEEEEDLEEDEENDKITLNSDLIPCVEASRANFGRGTDLFLEVRVVERDNFAQQYWTLALAELNGLRITFPF
jgi:hypothetical protein